jgi:hypothetical protein
MTVLGEVETTEENREIAVWEFILSWSTFIPPECKLVAVPTMLTCSLDCFNDVLVVMLRNKLNCNRGIQLWACVVEMIVFCTVSYYRILNVYWYNVYRNCSSHGRTMVGNGNGHFRFHSWELEMYFWGVTERECWLAISLFRGRETPMQ